MLLLLPLWEKMNGGNYNFVLRFAPNPATWKDKEKIERQGNMKLVNWDKLKNKEAP